MTMPRTLTLTLALLPFLLLAGCSDSGSTSNGPGGQSAADEGSLAHNGAGSGSHSSRFECDGSGEASFAANLGGGSVTVTVKDADGKTVYSKTATGPGQAADTKDVEGSSGTWTVSATRDGAFSGQYALDVDCR